MLGGRKKSRTRVFFVKLVQAQFCLPANCTGTYLSNVRCHWTSVKEFMRPGESSAHRSFFKPLVSLQATASPPCPNNQTGQGGEPVLSPLR